MPFRDVQLRAGQSGTGGETLTFTGYACVTEAPYEMSDWAGPFTEVVRQGAFAKTLGEGADVPFLVNHTGLTLASTKSGTLKLSEDDTGLHTEASLDPASPHVQALRSAMERGDVDEMSSGSGSPNRSGPRLRPARHPRGLPEQGGRVVVNYGANPHTSGAQLNSRELSGQLQALTEAERREVFERLAAEFTPT
jgi:HK97 family phage prohead protease